MDNASALFWMTTYLSTFYFMLSCNVACLATLSQTLKKRFPVKLTVLPFDWSGLLSLSLSLKKKILSKTDSAPFWLLRTTFTFTFFKNKILRKPTVLPFDCSGLLSLSLKKRFSENRQCSLLIGQDLRLFPIDLLAESVICASGQFLERTAVCETQNILTPSSFLLWKLQHSSDHQFYWSIEMSLDWY